MHKESTNTTSVSMLKDMEQKIFNIHSVKEASDDLDKMFFSFICDRDTEQAIERQSATVTYKLIKKVLSCIEKHQDPDDIHHLEISFDM